MQTNKTAHNFLLDCSSSDVNKFLFRIALRFAKNGNRVLYITTKPFDQLPIDENDSIDNASILSMAMNKNIFQNITFKYLKSLKALLKVMLEIHNWRLMPKIVIIDCLHTFFADSSPPTASIMATNEIETDLRLNLTPTNCDEFINDHMFVTASVHSAIDSLTKCFGCDCFSIICVDFHNSRYREVYERFTQIFLDSYYFKEEDICNNYCDLMNKFDRFLP